MTICVVVLVEQVSRNRCQGCQVSYVAGRGTIPYSRSYYYSGSDAELEVLSLRIEREPVFCLPYPYYSKSDWFLNGVVGTPRFR